MKSIIALSTFFLSTVALADAHTVLTLDRTNYKPNKQLHYDLVFDGKTCQINKKQPFDVYYIEKATGERLPEFSEDSKTYFGPRIDPSKVGPNQAELNFKALDEIENEIGEPATILVSIAKIPGGCATKADISYEGKGYVLEHIDLKMTKTFGFPTGISWVQLHGHDQTGPITDCVVGQCD